MEQAKGNRRIFIVVLRKLFADRHKDNGGGPNVGPNLPLVKPATDEFGKVLYVIYIYMNIERYVRIVLNQEKEVILHSEDSSTSAQGDKTFFISNLYKGKKKFGTLSGTINTHDINDGGAYEVRFRQLVFNLPGGQLIALGTSMYNTGPTFVPLDVGKTTTIAIVGGTGIYFAASGQLETTRNSNKTYRHVIYLKPMRTSNFRVGTFNF
jgi:hypothetical protein